MSPADTRSFIAVPTLPDLLVAAVSRRPAAEAVIFPDRRVTYAALLEGAEAMAKGLAGFGVGRGEHVGILMPNCVEYLEVLLGASLLGAIAVPINSRYRSSELAHVVADSGLRVLFVTDIVAEHVDHVEILRATFPDLGTPPHGGEVGVAPRCVMVGESEPDGFVSRKAFIESGAGVTAAQVHLARSRIRLRDPAIMIYTSGTTAQPKGCPLTHEALVRTAMQAGRTRFLLGPDDKLFDPLPMFHMSFMLPLVAVLDATAAIVSMTHFEAGPALKLMTREQVTVDFSTFPTITQALLNHPDYDAKALASVRIVNNVAPPDVLRALQAALPYAKQISAYGCTEAGGVVAFGEVADDDETRATTSGRPFEGIEVEVRGIEDGAVLRAGEVGEIFVRGYNLFEGYYNDPVKTAECLDSNGWFRTGDIGSLDEMGRVSYIGRTKDMLKVGGENVAAAEIESCLAMHPLVSIAQVVGIPDERLGEVAAAFVELRPNVAGDEALKATLIEHCRGRIASFKVPRVIVFVDSWPMSATKIQKFRLREQLLEKTSQ